MANHSGMLYNKAKEEWPERVLRQQLGKLRKLSKMFSSCWSEAS